MKLWSSLRRRLAREDGVSTTSMVLVFVPLAVAAFGFLVNGALHWIGMQYAQNATNFAARYTAAAIGDNPLPFIPGGGANMTPSQYLTLSLNNFFLTTPQEVNCGMVSNTAIANGVARCEVVYKTLAFPTDPVTRFTFAQPIRTVAEALSETGTNPNVQ